MCIFEYQTKREMENKVTFKKVEAGTYKLFLNGVEMVEYTKGLYSWYAAESTQEYADIFWDFPRHARFLIETDGTYFTKSEIKQCWESAIEQLNK